MVKTRSNSSTTASNGEKHVVSHENLEIAKSGNISLQQTTSKFASGEGKKEAIVVSLPDAGNEGNSLNSLSGSAFLRSQISKGEPEPVSCPIPKTESPQRNRQSHKRVSKSYQNGSHDNRKEQPSSTITSTDLKPTSTHSDQQGYCPGNIA